MAMQCPTCGSTNIQPMAVVHTAGAQHVHATHTAVTSDGQFVQGSSQGMDYDTLTPRKLLKLATDYRLPGGHVDCYVYEVPQPVSLAQFIAAFYSSTAFGPANGGLA